MDGGSILSDPIVNYGFAGFAIVLLGILIWLIREILKMHSKTTEALVASGEANKQAAIQLAEITQVIRALHDKITSRPWIDNNE